MLRRVGMLGTARVWRDRQGTGVWEERPVDKSTRKEELGSKSAHPMIKKLLHYKEGE